MGCDITLTGRGTNCRNSLGGIKNVYMSQWIDGRWITASGGATTGCTGAANVSFYTFNLLRNSGSFNQIVTSSVENGTVYFEQTLECVFGGEKTADDVEQLVELVKDRVAIIVQDRNDEYWVMGLTHGCLVTAGSVDSGAAPGDNNGFKLTFSAEELLPAVVLTGGQSATFVDIQDAP